MTKYHVWAHLECEEEDEDPYEVSEPRKLMSFLSREEAEDFIDECDAPMSTPCGPKDAG
jgi:hypothetical protein